MSTRKIARPPAGAPDPQFALTWDAFRLVGVDAKGRTTKQASGVLYGDTLAELYVNTAKECVRRAERELDRATRRPRTRKPRRA